MSDPTQADVLAALSAPGSSLFSPRAPPTTIPFSSTDFDQLLSSPSATEAGQTNARALYCIRGCGSVILAAGEGTYIVAEGGVLSDDPASPFVSPPPAPVPSSSSSSSSTSAPTSTSTSTSTPSTSTSTSASAPAAAGYWHVLGSPMTFDNVGFSKSPPGQLVPPSAPGSGGRIKYLACAECDLGPIGWSTEGGNEAWVAVERVRYKAA